MLTKIAVAGVGRVGETTALLLAQRNLCRELALLDVRAGLAEGAALDIRSAGPVLSFDTQVYGGADPALLAGAEMVIITAGSPRKSGQSRADLLEKNRSVIDSILDGVLVHAPNALVLVVTNPVDVMTWYAARKTGWPRNRVFGQAGVLDSTRMATFIAEAAALAPSTVDALVIGGHGDHMVPLPRYATINGLPARQFVTEQALHDAGERARHGGAEVLELRQDSSAYNAPAAAVTAMADAVAHDRKALMPCVAILEGEYGESNIAIGTPVVLGAGGMERVLELSLDQEERRAFEASVAAIRQGLGDLQAG